MGVMLGDKISASEIHSLCTGTISNICTFARPRIHTKFRTIRHSSFRRLLGVFTDTSRYEGQQSTTQMSIAAKG